jgi:hypothetical protein
MMPIGAGDRYTFASPEWLACLHGYLVANRPRVKEGRTIPDYSFSLHITNVPPEVNPAAAVGWTTRHLGGVFSFEAVPSPDADVASQVDWAVEHPLACMLSTDPRFRLEMEKLREAGSSDAASTPIDWASYPAQGHDDIVTFTK